MNVILSPETQKLLEEQMATGQFANADDLVRTALQVLHQTKAQDYEDLDAETRGAIDEAEAQYERGEARSWEEVRNELRERFIK